MTSLSQPVPKRDATATTGSRLAAFPADSLGFDYAYSLLTSFFVIGLFLDGWAHNHGKVDKSFFTPWHGVLYGSVLLIGLLLVITHFTNFRKGHSVFRALPRGYTLSLFGVALFFIAGGFDFMWHSVFGFEANLETLISPAHIFLAAAAFLFVTGPLRAVWQRTGDSGYGWKGLLPAIVSLTVVLSLLTFFTQFAHFTDSPDLVAGSYVPPQRFMAQQISVAGVLVGSTLTIGVGLCRSAH